MAEEARSDATSLVVFEFKMKAHRYSSSIFSGMIAFPYSSLHALSRGVSGFANSPGDPKMAMHVYVLDAQGAAMKGLPAEAGLSVLIFDANGEEHGRSKAGFKWALDIEGAIDLTEGGLNLRQVNDLQGRWPQPNFTRNTNIFSGGTEPMMGMANSNLAAALVEDIDPEFVVRAVRWFEKLVKIDNNLGTASFALIEIMQKVPPSSIFGRKEHKIEDVLTLCQRVLSMLRELQTQRHGHTKLESMSFNSRLAMCQECLHQMRSH
jgi:cysteine desulfurase